MPVPRDRLGESSKPKPCEGVKKRPTVRFRAIKPVISECELTMGGRKNKRGKAAEAHGGSPARKKGGSVDKDRSEEKQVRAVMECVVVSKASETNNNSGVVVIEGESRQIAMALKDLVAAMECDNQTVSDENSEGEVMSEEERRSSTKSSSSLSSEISEEERIRRQIRERNLKKHKMVRTRRGLVYETDFIEEDRKYMGEMTSTNTRT